MRAASHLPGMPHPPASARVEDVARVWESMGAARERWLANPLVDRVATVARVAVALLESGPGAWREALERSTGFSSGGLDAAWRTTFAPVDAASLREALRAEGLDAVESRHLGQRGLLPRRIVHVVPGNVFPATFTMLVRGWLLGAAQWLRPSEREPSFAACIAVLLSDLAPELAAMTAVLWWPRRGSGVERAVLAGADVVTCQGDDDSVEAVRRKAAEFAPAARFLGYGARWSAAILSGQAQTSDTARSVAHDVMLFDQQGCLSPTLVLAEGGPRLEAWCDDLARHLDWWETNGAARGEVSEAGRAALRRWRESMRLGVALGEVERLWESPGSTAWAVALLGTCRYEPSPRGRHVVVAPFEGRDEIETGLGGMRSRLQGLAADLQGWDRERARDVLDLLQPARVAPPGTLQLAPPGWVQDHLPPLRSLLRA